MWSVEMCQTDAIAIKDLAVQMIWCQDDNQDYFVKEQMACQHLTL